MDDIVVPNPQSVTSVSDKLQIESLLATIKVVQPPPPPPPPSPTTTHDDKTQGKINSSSSSSSSRKPTKSKQLVPISVDVKTNILRVMYMGNCIKYRVIDIIGGIDDDEKNIEYNRPVKYTYGTIEGLSDVNIGLLCFPCNWIRAEVMDGFDKYLPFDQSTKKRSYKQILFFRTDDYYKNPKKNIRIINTKSMIRRTLSNTKKNFKYDKIKTVDSILKYKNKLRVYRRTNNVQSEIWNGWIIPNDVYESWKGNKLKTPTLNGKSSAHTKRTSRKTSTTVAKVLKQEKVIKIMSHFEDVQLRANIVKNFERMGGLPYLINNWKRMDHKGLSLYKLHNLTPQNVQLLPSNVSDVRMLNITREDLYYILSTILIKGFHMILSHYIEKHTSSYTNELSLLQNQYCYMGLSMVDIGAMKKKYISNRVNMLKNDNDDKNSDNILQQFISATYNAVKFLITTKMLSDSTKTNRERYNYYKSICKYLKQHVTIDKYPTLDVFPLPDQCTEDDDNNNTIPHYLSQQVKNGDTENTLYPIGDVIHDMSSNTRLILKHLARYVDCSTSHYLKMANQLEDINNTRQFITERGRVEYAYYVLGAQSMLLHQNITNKKKRVRGVDSKMYGNGSDDNNSKRSRN